MSIFVAVIPCAGIAGTPSLVYGLTEHRIYCGSSLLVTGVLRLELEFNMHAYTRSPINKAVEHLRFGSLWHHRYALLSGILENNEIAEQQNK